MTVSSEVSTVFYDGDGSTTTFPVPYYFLLESDLVVHTIDADGSTTPYVLGADYTVSGAGLQSGGSITTIGLPIPHGKRIQIERDPPATQETAYQANDPFPAAEHEKALDKLTMLIQRVSRVGYNSIHYPLTETTDGTLPQRSGRANTLVGHDANGNLVVVPYPSSIGAGDRIPFTLKSGEDFQPGDITVTLPRAPGSKGNLEMNFDGNPQSFSEWDLSGADVTFTSPIPADISEIWGYIGTTLSTYLPPAQSVGEEQLTWGSFLGRMVNSVADLKKLNKAIYSRAFLLGYYEPGDGGGGPVWMDPGDNTTPGDDGSVFVAYDNARWKRPAGSAMSVLQFGVKADDGITDNSARLKAVRDWLASKPIRPEVYFPSGTYGYSVSPNWAIQNAVIRGVGEVHLKYSGTDHAVIIDGTGQPHAGCYNNTFWNFTIDAPATAKNAALVKWSHHSQYKLKVRGAGSTWAGIEVYGCVCTNFESPEVSPNADGAWYQNAMPQYGMKFSGPVGGQASYNKINNPIMEGLAKPVVGCGIYLEGAFGNVFVGGTSEGCTIGIATDTNANGCLGNKFFGIDLEANTDLDIFDQGLANEYHGVDTTRRVVVTAAAIMPKFYGGQHFTIEVASGATRPAFFGVTYNRTGVGGTGEFLNGEPSTVRHGCMDGKTGAVGPLTQGSVAVGPSPFTYTNTRGNDVTLSISGGTSVGLQMVRQGVGTLLAQPNGMVTLSPGDQLVITYTGTPSVWVFSR